MGNVVGKKDDETIDGGFTFPTGTVYQKSNCDLRLVRKYVLEQKISPFYKGSGDALNDQSIECPICFLYYPSNINYSRCCNQPICTECFVQIQQPKTGGPASCPFCVQLDYGVVYTPPPQSIVSETQIVKNESERVITKKKEKEKEEKFHPIPANSSLVVTIDNIRPDGRHVPPPPPDNTPVRRMTIGGVSHRSSRHASSRRSGLSPSSFSGEPNRYNQDNLAQHQHYHRASRHSQGQRNTLALSHADIRDVESELEQLMLLEAIRLSILEEEKQKKAREEKNDDLTSSSSSESDDLSGSDSDTDDDGIKRKNRNGNSKHSNSNNFDLTFDNDIGVSSYSSE